MKDKYVHYYLFIFFYLNKKTYYLYMSNKAIDIELGNKSNSNSTADNETDLKSENSNDITTDRFSLNNLTFIKSNNQLSEEINPRYLKLGEVSTFDKDSKTDKILNNIIEDKESFPKKLGYKEVHEIIYKTFFTKQHYYSSVFDIISSYIKAQKILYLQSRSYSVFFLNCLMLPAIFLSSLASVLSLSIENYIYGGVILASVNAFNAFLLSVLNYSKLDAASEAHKTSAHQYDKLQSMCEFTSGKILLLPGTLKFDNESINDESLMDPKEKLDFIEQKIIEIKETNTFIIPAEVVKRLPKTYHTNIFSKIKELLKDEIITMNQIKDYLNELRPLEYKVKYENVRHDKIDRMILQIRNKINKLIGKLIDETNDISKIEDMFLDEIQYVNKLSRCYRICC